MCRLLAFKSDRAVPPEDFLAPFAEIAKSSEEYQGDGWGCAFYHQKNWKIYHSLKPVWEDDLTQFPRSNFFLAHARAAFRQEEIDVVNNMPFHDHPYLFVFNGELHGVRMKVPGRIGAERLFNLVLQMRRNSLLEAMGKASQVIRKRTRYVKAMNFMISDGSRVFVHSFFSENPDYFTMHHKKTDHDWTICSQPFQNESGWQPIANDTMEVFS